MFRLIDWLSCWARLTMIVISTSPLASSVFRANRLIDLVMIPERFNYSSAGSLDRRIDEQMYTAN